MPLEAEGFNYEILDVEIPTREQNKKERLRIDLLPEGFDSRSFVTGKDVRFGNHKKGWLFLFASLMVAATGTIPYVITNHSARQYYFGGDSYLESFEFEVLCIFSYSHSHFSSLVSLFGVVELLIVNIWVCNVKLNKVMIRIRVILDFIFYN